MASHTSRLAVKHAQVAIMDGKLQQAEQCLRDGHFAAAQDLAKTAGASYEAYMYGLTSMQYCKQWLLHLCCAQSIYQSNGGIGQRCVAWSPAFTSAIRGAHYGWLEAQLVQECRGNDERIQFWRLQAAGMRLKTIF